MDDRELIEAFTRGDARAFEALYLRHRGWVAGLARRICGNREDALDVLQETFAYVARRAPAPIFKAFVAATSFSTKRSWMPACA